MLFKQNLKQIIILVIFKVYNFNNPKLMRLLIKNLSQVTAQFLHLIVINSSHKLMICPNTNIKSKIIFKILIIILIIFIQKIKEFSKIKKIYKGIIISSSSSNSSNKFKSLIKEIYLE